MKPDGNFDIVIIGGGASGMMAAIACARAGKNVLVLEKKERTGKKLLATGNGKCNFTNADMDYAHFHGNRDLIDNSLSRFSEKETLAFFREIGVWPKQKNGYYYPNSEQAAAVADALEAEMTRLGVKILTGTPVDGIRKEAGHFCVHAGSRNFTGTKVLIACGLKANPVLGSDGSIIPVVEALGHHFTKILPALCGFKCSGLSFRKCAGVRTEAEISVFIDGEKAASDRGELQLTDYGISGIPVFQVSRYASVGLAEKRRCTAVIDFLPSFAEEDLMNEWSRRGARDVNACARTLTFGLLPDKLGQVLMESAGINPADPLAMISEKKRNKLVSQIKAAEIPLKEARGFEFAQVCAGGVRTEEIITESLESALVPGLYFAGEILDVDGICGGYNLQWAWSSGYNAAMHMTR